jgi:hypothetical protein
MSAPQVLSQSEIQGFWWGSLRLTDDGKDGFRENQADLIEELVNEEHLPAEGSNPAHIAMPDIPKKSPLALGSFDKFSGVQNTPGPVGTTGQHLVKIRVSHISGGKHPGDGGHQLFIGSEVTPINGFNRQFNHLRIGGPPDGKENTIHGKRFRSPGRHCNFQPFHQV